MKADSKIYLSQMTIQAQTSPKELSIISLNYNLKTDYLLKKKIRILSHSRHKNGTQINLELKIYKDSKIALTYNKIRGPVLQK